jgi:hypothetical protein
VLENANFSIQSARDLETTVDAIALLLDGMFFGSQGLKKTVTILNLLHDMLRLFAPRVCEFRLHEGRHGQDAQEREGEKGDSAEGEGGRPLPPNLLRRLVLPAAAHLDLCAAGPCLYRKRTAQSRAREKWLEDSRQADETSSFPHEQHFIDSTVMVDT